MPTAATFPPHPTGTRPLPTLVTLLLSNLLTVLPATAQPPSSPAPNPDAATHQLALDLMADGLLPQAALEFRRLAAEAADPADASAYTLAAATAYLLANDAPRTVKMLDQAEDADPANEKVAQTLRAENAWRAHQWAEARFYLESLQNNQAPENPAARIWTTRRLAAAMAADGDLDAADAILQKSPDDLLAARMALHDFRSDADKSATLGGLLGIIPGLGHAYAGEYGNALRAALINALFIYGMIDTADNEQWGAFTAIAFFELTWYTGSIYGGVDAAHRFNRERRETLIDTIAGDTALEINLQTLPLVTLKYRF